MFSQKKYTNSSRIKFPNRSQIPKKKKNYSVFESFNLNLKFFIWIFESENDIWKFANFSKFYSISLSKQTQAIGRKKEKNSCNEKWYRQIADA